MASPSSKPKRVSLIRDFPSKFGTRSIENQTSEVVAVTTETRQESIGVANRDYHRRPDDRRSEVESIDVIMKKAGLYVSANTDAGKGRFVSSFSKFAPSCGSKVKPLSSEEAFSLIGSQSRRRQVSDSSSSNQREFSLAKAVENYRNPQERINATAPRAKTHKPSQNRDARRSNQLGLIPVRQNKIVKVLNPREKVHKALRHFKLVFKELNREKVDGEPKTATNKIHYVTRAILKREGIQVHAQKMIGPVPGIKIGDEFQYKSELNLIGLHFNIRGGIDYINRGGLKLATSIMSLEGNGGYMDRFNSDVMVYSGQGGNLTSKDQKVIKDQKLETANLALANSMEKKTPVRVIRGKKRVYQRGKRYVYDGLYLVQEYWQERARRGNILFMFKLCRVPG